MLIFDQFGCPYSRDPVSKRAGTGGPTPRSTYNVWIAFTYLHFNANVTSILQDMPSRHSLVISLIIAHLIGLSRSNLQVDCKINSRFCYISGSWSRRNQALRGWIHPWWVQRGGLSQDIERTWVHRIAPASNCIYCLRKPTNYYSLVDQKTLRSLHFPITLTVHICFCLSICLAFKTSHLFFSRSLSHFSSPFTHVTALCSLPSLQNILHGQHRQSQLRRIPIFYQHCSQQLLGLVRQVEPFPASCIR